MAEASQDSPATGTVPTPTPTELRIRDDLRDESYSDDQYAEMLALYEGTLQSIAEGEIVKSTVLRVTDSHVILDVGFKSEGAIPIDEFKPADGVAAGDEVEVLLERLEDENGAVILSKKKADFMRVWEKIRAAFEEGTPVQGTLQKKIKGGVVVDLMGVDAFLPGSQIALRRVPNIDELLGETYEFKIIKLNKRRRNIVVSRRVILEAERATKREHLMKELEVGQVRTGVVKNITDFGAFIDLGGVDGLLHITDMSYGRVSHPSEMVRMGDEVEVKILDIDWKRERISLGIKQLQEYPWENVAEKYPVGARVQGKVVSITNYGAFVELEPGIEGLVHISEMSWTRNVRHPSTVVSIGETIEAVVLKVDSGEEKISLGMKQTEEDPWMVLPMKYPVGTRITGKVRNLTSFGAFVEIEAGIDGLIHISDMSWTKRVQHPSEVVKKGDVVEVVILNIDADNKRISLGLKQAQDDPWLKIGEDYPVGFEGEGHVARFQDGGAVVDLGDVEGFVQKENLGLPDEPPVEEQIKIGQAVIVTVMEVDPIHHRMLLSAKQFLDTVVERAIPHIPDEDDEAMEDMRPPEKPAAAAQDGGEEGEKPTAAAAQDGGEEGEKPTAAAAPEGGEEIEKATAAAAQEGGEEGEKPTAAAAPEGGDEEEKKPAAEAEAAVAEAGSKVEAEVPAEASDDSRKPDESAD